MKKIFFTILAAASFLCLSWGPANPAWGYGDKPADTRQTNGSGIEVTFRANLVNPAVKAAQKSATVEVKVTGVNLIDPDTTDGKPHAGQAHLHYQLDGGPVVATTATKLSYHGLTPGQHKIVVSLAENDHTSTGNQTTLTVQVP
jgi:hypothetical protein